MVKVSWLLISATLVLSLGPAFGQEIESATPRPIGFKTALDDSLTIRRISVLPLTDNVEGIYAKPVQEVIHESASKLHRWDLVPANLVGQSLTPLDFEEDPASVEQVTKTLNVDAIVAGRISKSASGVTIILDLFLRSDGKLLLQEMLKDHPHFDTKDVQAQTKKLFAKLLDRLPYAGLVQSRSGNRVTLNIGSQDGIKTGHVLTSVLFLSLNRHPKFNFLISSEKEVLGKIRIDKVDDTVSFGVIVAEKERGAIQKLSKVTSAEMVTYGSSESARLGGGSEQNVDTDKAEQKIAFGNNPREWVPSTPPTLGRASFKFGLGMYSYHTVYETLGSLNADAPLYPNLNIAGELWVTPSWIVRGEINQGVTSVSNPRSGSNPDKLNLSISKYRLLMGYNFLVREDFFGPKIQLLGGFSQLSTFVDASTPLALTGTTYSGFDLGFVGSFPLGDDNLWEMGISLFLTMSPNLSETPDTSASSSTNRAANYSIFVSKRLSERLRGVGSMDFESYSSDFSGTGTRPNRGITSSQTSTTLAGGIEYYF